MVCKDIINEGHYFSCDNFKFNYKGEMSYVKRKDRIKW